jgi:membrane-associated phospholipid phosphatase
MKQNISEVLHRIKWLLIPYLVILCICLVIKLIYTRETIYFTVNGVNSPLADFLAPFATDLGNGWFAVALSLLLILFSYRKFLLLASSYILTSLLAQVVKFIVDAPRPKLYFKALVNKIHFIKGVDILITHSFPSGHTVTAFSAAVVLTYFSKNSRWGIVYLIIAILVGYSRMYLSEHFFEDVIAGSVIGVIVTVIWLYWLDNKAFLQRPKWQKGLLNK